MDGIEFVAEQTLDGDPIAKVVVTAGHAPLIIIVNTDDNRHIATFYVTDQHVEMNRTVHAGGAS